MNEFIYKASDGSDMDRDDLLSWLTAFKVYNPRYVNWDFDAITGGEMDFFEIEDYLGIKAYYEKYIDNE